MFPWLHMWDVKWQTEKMLVYPVMWQADIMHLCFWNIKLSCIIITRVTQSAHVRCILYHKLLVSCLLGIWGWDPFDQMSSWPDVVSLLSTRCLYWGGGVEGAYMGDVVGVHLTKHQPDTQANHMSCWPAVVPLLTNRCLYLGALRGIVGDAVVVHLTKHQPDPQADEMSCWPAVVPLLTTRCLYWGWGWGVQGPMECRGHQGLHLENEDSLLQSILENSRHSIENCRQ